MNPLVSIIVTSYNHAEYLDERMSSLLAQTYHPVEVIVVDDCSSDNSLTVLDKYRHHDHISIHALGTNVGYAEACNFGVKHSRGEYVMFAECDDFSEADHLAQLMKILFKHDDVGVAYCRSNMVNASGVKSGDDWLYQKRIFKRRFPSDRRIPISENQKYFLRQCIIPNMSAAVIRKKCLDQIGGFNSRYKICADWDFWCRLSKTIDFYYTRRALNNFRTHDATVRATSSINASMVEISELLQNAAEGVLRTPMDRFLFYRNIGLIWADYFISSPLAWIKAYRGTHRNLRAYQSCPLIFLFLGFLHKATISISKRLSSVANTKSLM